MGKKLQLFKTVMITCIFISGLLLQGACSENSTRSSGFTSIGEFSIRYLPDNCKEIRDGAGRIMVLVPREQNPPEGYEKDHIIEIPVKRVVVSSGFNVSLLKALGVLNTLVGVTHEKKYWTIKKVVQGMKSGKITCIGRSGAIDFEKLKAIRPDLMLTWDACAIAKITRLNIPGVITTTGEAMDLKTRIQFIRFLAVFFNRQKAADAYITRIENTIENIRNRELSMSKNNAWKKPEIIWGDIFEKRVLVEPGNSWAAELINLSGGDYLFNDIKGAS